MFDQYKSNVLLSSQYHSLLGLYPIWVGHLTALPNYECKPRVLDDYFIIYVAKGRGKFRCKGIEYDLEKGDVFFLFPSVVHYYITDQKNLLDLWWVGFNGPNSRKLSYDLGVSPDNPIIKNIQGTEVFDTIREIVDGLDEIHQGTVLKASGNLYRLLGQLIGLHSRNLPFDSRIQSEVAKPIEKALAFIDANYPHDITIGQIAAHVGLSRTHFATRFKDEVGYSPSEHLAKMRLKQAKHYLANSNLSIKEVAHSVGFNDPQYFSRFFSSHEGISPSEFRQTSIIKQKDAVSASKTAI